MASVECSHYCCLATQPLPTESCRHYENISAKNKIGTVYEKKGNHLCCLNSNIAQQSVLPFWVCKSFLLSQPVPVLMPNQISLSPILPSIMTPYNYLPSPKTYPTTKATILHISFLLFCYVPFSKPIKQLQKNSLFLLAVWGSSTRVLHPSLSLHRGQVF